MSTPDNLPTPNPILSEMNTPIKWLLFSIGFLSWYLANGYTWFVVNNGSCNGFEGEGALCLVSNLIIFPVNVIALLLFAKIRSTKPIALGILAALSLNFVISLVLGLMTNGICFIPFFVK